MNTKVKSIDRITFTPGMMQGQACIRGMRIPVAMIIDNLAAGHSAQEILDAYPELEKEDIDASLQYAAVKFHDHEVELTPA